MHLLIIGNGFDLAHGLPTKYSDFLNVLNSDSLFYKYIKSKGLKKPFNNLIQSKLIKHLQERNKKNGWIDFENEIKMIIDSVCKFPSSMEKIIDLESGEFKYRIESDTLRGLPPFILHYVNRKRTELKKQWNEDSLTKLFKEVHEHIFIFIQIFQAYILWISENHMDSLVKKKLFSEFKIDHLLSFNYTNTFTNLYDKKMKKENICYVHGKVESIKKINIVMGVGSDYYDDALHQDFVEFFKFFQRYKYSSDNSYLNWINDIVDNKSSESNKIYIYGHSLDPTDGDILKQFFKLENAEIFIYFLDENDKLKLEKNLLGILHKDLFSSYLTGSDPKIKFTKIN